MKYTLLLFFAVTLTSHSLIAQGTWTQKQDFPDTKREGTTGFVIGNKAYMGTGYFGGSCLKDFWEYNPITDVWTQKADFPGTERNSASGFAIGDKGYLGTGTNCGGGFGYKKDFYEYDPSANTWSQKADYGGAEMAYGTAFVLDGKGYLGTGTDLSLVWRKDMWMYDPDNDTWTQKNDFGGAERVCALSFSIGTHAYAGTGQDMSFNGLKDWWEYNADTDAWTQKADFGGSGRWWPTGFVIDEYGYVGTGNANNVKQADFWRYDPSLNIWEEKAPFEGVARDVAFGFAVEGKGYIAFGNTTIPMGDVWEYTPGSETSAALLSTPGICISVFPNPMKDHAQLIISGTNAIDETAQLRLFDSKGKLLQTFPIEKNRVEIGGPHLVAGIYFYEVFGAQSLGSGKLIVLP